MSKPGRRRTNRYIVVGAVAGVVIIALLAWFLLIRSNDTNAVTYKAGTAAKMTLTSSVSGTGNVSLSTSSVTPSVTGTVTGLTVKVGDTVTAGQLLYTLDNDQLDIDVENAQNSYDSAVASVNKSHLNVLQAEQDLQDLEDKYNSQSTSTTVTSASTSSVSLTATPSTGGTDGTGASSTAASSSGTVTSLDIKVAEANVTSAKLTYESAKTQVESAELSLQQAQKKAAARKVTAPISGVVTAVNVANGDDTSSSSSSQSSPSSNNSPSASNSSSSNSSSSSSSSSAAIVIANKSTFSVDLSLGESDIISVKVGQRAILTFDAIEDLSLTGRVTKVDSTGTNSSGVVSYTVTVTPDISNDKILGGMSVSANIITETRTDVIAVPNAAVKTDTTGTYVLLYKGTNVSPTRQTVVTGLATDSYTEITSGLTAGTQVVIQTVNSKSSTSTTARSGSGILGGSTNRGSTTRSNGGLPSGGQLPSGAPIGGF